MHNENKSRQTQQSTTSVQNLNIQDTEGVTIANSSGINLTLTDQGAVGAARDIALDSLATSGEAQRGARELVGRIGESAFEFGTDALDTVASAVDRASGRAVDAVLEATSGVGDTLGDITRSSLTFGRDLAEGALDFGGERTREALTFGRDALSIVDAGARDALTFGGIQTENALTFAQGLFADALEGTMAVVRESQEQVGNTVTNLNTIARQQATSTDERVQDIAQKALIAGAVMVGLIVLSQVWSRR